MKPLALGLLQALLLGLDSSINTPAPPTVKRVEIDKSSQCLRAYENSRLVIESRVSTGRNNSTPNGRYRVVQKERMHYSKRYRNAPMPYSVQYSGHYFIHGFDYVPDIPSSHGCIRVPLIHENPARQFFEWVELGTPIDVLGEWSQPLQKNASKKGK